MHGDVMKTYVILECSVNDHLNSHCIKGIRFSKPCMERLDVENQGELGILFSKNKHNGTPSSLGQEHDEGY